MTDQKKSVRIPHYYDDFKCIGGGCTDNCCIGWDVEIDKKTYQRYQKITEPELSKLIRQRISRNPGSYSHEVDYGIVELNDRNRCPFLNEKQLCKIQAKLGHDFLSNVCAAYPRYANEINGVSEYSLNVSCPEAARLVLLNKNGIDYQEKDHAALSPCIINYSLCTAAHGGNRMIEHFSDLRTFTVSVLRYRSYTLWERLLILGYFYRDLQQIFSGRHTGSIQKLIRISTEQLANGNRHESCSAAPCSLPSQYRIVSEIIEKMKTLTVIDSERYLRFAREASDGIRKSEASGTEERGSSYQTAFHQHYAPFMTEHEYILENYLVNYVISGLFPAAEIKNPFEAFLMLILRYALIQYQLIGISANRGGLTEEICIEFIQVFSKAVEHHHTYLSDIAAYMKKRNYHTMQTAELLVKTC